MPEARSAAAPTVLRVVLGKRLADLRERAGVSYEQAGRALDVTHATLERALSALKTLDYCVETDWRPSRVELAASTARWVDLHPVVFDDQGTGWQANIDDLPPFCYPPHAFTGGLINGSAVRCLSVPQQLLFHRGYPPRPHDLADVALLQGLQATS